MEWPYWENTRDTSYLQKQDSIKQSAIQFTLKYQLYKFCDLDTKFGALPMIQA